MNSAIAGLVTGKAKKYLRTSTTLFLLSLVLVGTYLMFVERQQLQARTDFSDNVKVHIIKVTGLSGSRVNEYLKFSDVARVEQAVQSEHPAARFESAVEYSLGFGIPDSEGVDRFIYGIQGNGARLLGIPSFDEGVVYSVGAPNRTMIALKVPIIKVEQGGMSSGKSTTRTFRTMGGVAADNPLSVLGGMDRNALYVDEKSFTKIVEKSFHTKWPDFQRQYDEENIYGTQVVKNVYLYVDELDDVKPVAESVAAAGYSTTYTLEAFEDLAGSVSTSSLIGLITVLVACLGCFIYILLSFTSYLNVSHKDMAILKHFGFNEAQLARVYARQARKVFDLVGLMVGGYILVAGIAFLPRDRLALISINIAFCYTLIGMLYLAIRYAAIPRHVGRGVLDLLKKDREFE